MTNQSDNPPIKMVRLKNGEDVVCEVVEIGDDECLNYHLINPLKVLYSPTGKGFIQIAFMPWVFSRICEKQEFTIDSNDVLFVAETSEYMHNYYWETLNGPEESEDEPLTPEEEKEMNDLEGENFVENLLNYLATNGKRTLH